MNHTPYDVMENPIWWFIAAAGALALAWAKRLNPWPLLQRAAISLNTPLMEKHLQPIDERLDRLEGKVDRLCGAFDELPGAGKAKAAARAKREGWGE